MPRIPVPVPVCWGIPVHWLMLTCAPEKEKEKEREKVKQWRKCLKKILVRDNYVK